MCGIAAFLGRESFPVDQFFCSLAHRGPNGRGVCQIPVGEGQKLYLLHTRLAILDLSDAAAQPMRDTVTGGTLVFNGEIYNYRALRRGLGGAEVFRSTGDTEVLLRGLTVRGTDFFRELDGMFALVWHDRLRNRLVVARDPLGIKPLYYTRTRDGGWLFASEVRAIVQSGLWEGDWYLPGVLDFLRFGAMQEPETLFSGICAFPAGHWGGLNLHDPVRLRTESFWPIERIILGESAPKDAVAWHNEVWRETVLEHLESDVPTGVYLSGGLDSTALLEAIPPERRGAITAFTLGGQLTTNDELQLAATTAKNLGVRHQGVRLSDAELPQWLGDGLRAMDQPSADGINTYLVSRASKAAGLTVALSGTGADELHGAYGHAVWLPRFASMVVATGPLAPVLEWGLVQVMRRLKDEVTAERLGMMFAQAGCLWRLVQEKRRYFTRLQILGFWPSARDLLEVWRAPTDDLDAFARLDAFNAVSLAELRGYLRNMLLRDADWATMANQQELRVPFLGRRYVECALRLPTGLRRRRGGMGKPLIAGTLSPVNRELVTRPKTGFNLALGQFLLGPLRDVFQHAVRELRERLGFVLDAEVELGRLAASRESRQAYRLWALLALGDYVGRVRFEAGGRLGGDKGGVGAGSWEWKRL